MTPIPPNSLDPRPDTPVKIAVVLCWLWGVYLAASAVAILIPLLRLGRPLLVPGVMVVLGVVFCGIGTGLFRMQKWAANAVTIVASLQILGLVALHAPVRLPGVVVMAALLILVRISWSRFDAKIAAETDQGSKMG